MDLTYTSFIHGEWQPAVSKAPQVLVNPATARPFAAVHHVDGTGLDRALASAEQGLAAWAAVAAARRADILEKAAELLQARTGELARQLTRENGKPLAEASGELMRAVETFRWTAGVIRDGSLDGKDAADHKIRPMPLGVVAAFAPWNYPAVIVARKIAFALAAGCSVIIKPAEETPSSPVAIVEALSEAGLPRGVVNLVFGVPSEVSSHLLNSGTVRAMSFTGSSAVGKELAALASGQLVKCVMELGGHSPVIIFKDADVKKAAEAVFAYKFDSAGQSCNAPSRVYVQQEVYDDFLTRFTDLVAAIRLGDGNDPATTMGPMANARGVTRVQDLVADAVGRGASLHFGGRPGPEPGFYFEPTLLTDLPPDSRILRDEPFGPVLPVMPFTSFDEAIELANSTVYGLASYVFSSSEETCNRAAAQLAAGSIGINALRGVPPSVAIGGIRDSGYGVEGGLAGIREFQSQKLIYSAS